MFTQMWQHRILVEPAPTVDSAAGAFDGLPCQLILKLQMHKMTSASLPARCHELGVTKSSPRSALKGVYMCKSTKINVGVAAVPEILVPLLSAKYLQWVSLCRQVFA